MWYFLIQYMNAIMEYVFVSFVYTLVTKIVETQHF